MYEIVKENALGGFINLAALNFMNFLFLFFVSCFFVSFYFLFLFSSVFLLLSFSTVCIDLRIPPKLQCHNIIW